MVKCLSEFTTYRKFFIWQSISICSWYFNQRVIRAIIM